MSDTLKNALNALLEEGEELSEETRNRVRAFGSLAIHELIKIATSEDLNTAPSDEPQVWAPLHAIEILGDLNAIQAIEPLLSMFDQLEDDWLDQYLPEFFGKLGEPGISPLEKILADPRKSPHIHARVSQSLVKIVERHPETRARVIAILAPYLEPEHTQTADQELRAGFIVGDLCDLRATETLPAIRRAFAEDRVDPQVTTLDDVEREMRGESFVADEPDFDKLIEKRRNEPLSLVLKCNVCGRERRHQVPVLFVDLATMDRHERGEKTKYSEFVIPQRVTCPKCGVIDQYKFTSWAHLAVTSDLITRQARHEKSLPKTGNIRYTRFALNDGREMHPLEARDLLREQVALNPKQADLRVRYANVLRMLGYLDEAIGELESAIHLDPDQFEAHMNLGRIYGVHGNFEQSKIALQRALQLLPTCPKYTYNNKQAIALEISHHLDQIEHQEKFDPSLMYEIAPIQSLPTAPHRASSKQPALQDSSKIGRNDPCFCGSDKKYKHCHGR